MLGTVRAGLKLHIKSTSTVSFSFILSDISDFKSHPEGKSTFSFAPISETKNVMLNQDNWNHEGPLFPHPGPKCTVQAGTRG